MSISIPIYFLSLIWLILYINPKKRQRLTNLNHTRTEIAGQLQQLMAEHQLQIDKFAQLTSWTPFYLQALLEGRANPNIGELNYLASIFDHKLKIEFVV